MSPIRKSFMSTFNSYDEDPVLPLTVADVRLSSDNRYDSFAVFFFFV